MTFPVALSWNRSITVQDVLTYAPILISLIALHYSRRAFVYQLKIKRSEQVWLVSLRSDQRDGGLVLNNPGKVPLVGAECWYYHRQLGAYQLYIDCRLDKADRYVWSPLEGQKSGRLLSRPRNIKRKYGRLCIAEAIVLDAGGEEWYINSHNKKFHLPRRFANAALVRSAIRLAGYSPWSRLGPIDLPGILLWMGALVLAVDHYINGGKLMDALMIWMGALVLAIDQLMDDLMAWLQSH